MRRISRSSRWLDSIRSLSAAASLPASPPAPPGIRTEKSPRCTAASTRSIAFVSSPSAPLLGPTPGLTVVLTDVLVANFLPSFSGGTSVALQAEWNPEFDLGPGARLALHMAPAPGQLSALAHRDQADVSRDARRFRDHEARAVVGDHDPDTAIDDLRAGGDAGRPCVLLHIGERLGDVLHDDRLDRRGHVAGHAAVDVGLDAGAEAHRLEAFADPFLQVSR